MGMRRGEEMFLTQIVSAPTSTLMTFPLSRADRTLHFFDNEELYYLYIAASSVKRANNSSIPQLPLLVMHIKKSQQTERR